MLEASEPPYNRVAAASASTIVRDRAAATTPSDGPSWDRAFDLLSAVVGGIVLMMILVVFRDYGVTWDETWHLTYGRHVIHWYSSGFTDENALTYRADYLYGGGFDGLGYLARQISPYDEYQTIHLFGPLVSLFGLLGAWKLGRLLGGPAAGFATLVLLVLTPEWWTHMFNNPKDMPFAVGYVWALYYEIRILRMLPAIPRAEWVKLGIALGVAMSVRIAGLLAICYLVMLLGLWVLWQARERRSWTLIPHYVGRLGIPLFISSAGAWALMLVLWPWAQLDPLRRPLIVLSRMSAFNLHERNMPFGYGRKISTLEPPPDYLLRYFGFKMPELTVALVLVALVVVIVRLVRLRKTAKARKRALTLEPGAQGAEVLDTTDLALERRRLAAACFIAFALIFPPAYAIIKSSPLYDGLRHFLFLVPILTVVTGVTLVAGLRWLAQRSQVAAWAGYFVVLGFCVRMIWSMIQIHPHQAVWFNQLVGGLPGAFGRYDTDYYGNSYKEGFETLREHLWKTERERFLAAPYTVAACMPDFVAREYLGANFELRPRGSKADFWIGYTRNNCYLQHIKSPELTRVERFDTLLVLIRDMRSQSREQRKYEIDEVLDLPLDPDDDEPEREGEAEEDDGDDPDRMGKVEARPRPTRASPTRPGPTRPKSKPGSSASSTGRRTLESDIPLRSSSDDEIGPSE